MVEPRYHSNIPNDRYRGVKDNTQKNWDRNKARMESIYQLPMRDYRQTAAKFGIPPSIADITTTEKSVPKMECTSTTRSDYCTPSLDRYMKIEGVCPEKNYPTSSGLEYCPGRESKVDPSPPIPDSVPSMPQTRSTCPVSRESLLPSIRELPNLKYPPTIPQYASTQNSGPLPPSLDHRLAEESDDLGKYRPNVDYLEARKGFKWPLPTEKLNSHNFQDGKIEDFKSDEIQNHGNSCTNNKFEAHRMSEERFGYDDVNNQTIDYAIETEDLEERKLQDAMLERARLQYEKNIGTPGSTVPLVKAGAEPPNAIAHYDVPDYTEGSAAGGMIRSKFGSPNRDMKLPISDPMYPKPQYNIPPPEAGLTKSGYSAMLDENKGTAGIAHMPPVRYPDKIYNTVRYMETDNVETSPRSGGGDAERFIPSMAAQDNLQPTPIQHTQPSEEKIDWEQSPGETPTETNSDKPKVEPQSLKGLRRIQTSNQVYGSWIDDPYLKDNDWWFKARPQNPRTKTYLSKYKEENGWK